MITIIAAVARDGGIGYEGDLLWHLPADLRHFKSVTLGAPVVMGRNTWESLPRRPLPGRRNVVVSRNTEYAADGAEVFDSIESALAAATEGADNVFVIGGATLYAAALPMAEALELTEIDAVAENCDTYFPQFDRTEWDLEASEACEDKGISFRFNRYVRR